MNTYTEIYTIIGIHKYNHIRSTTDTIPLRAEKAIPVATTTTTIFLLTKNSHPAVISPFCNRMFCRAATLKAKVKQLGESESETDQHRT